MKRVRFISSLGDAVIPLMGWLFLDWGIYFILLFYFIDLIFSEIFSYIKVRKILDYNKIKFPFSLTYGRLMLNSSLVILIIGTAFVAVYTINPQIHFWDEFILFLKYKEVGIPIQQGYILLPIVLLGNLQQYKMLFVRPKIYQLISWKKLILVRRTALLIAILGGLLTILISCFLSPPGYIYIIGIILVKFYIEMKILID